MADLQDEPHPVGIGAEDLPVPAGPETKASALDRAAALLSVHPVADGCNTLVWTLRQSPYHDIDTPDTGVDTDIPRLRAGGVGAQFWSLLVPPQGRPGEDEAGDRVVSDTLEQIDAALTLVRRYPDSLRLALSADDMADARNRGRIASFLGPVPGRALAGSLGALRAFHALGVRILAPAGAPWAGETLTAFGHEVVHEANRLAILLDLAGCEPAAARRLAGASKAPVIISNTAAAALNPHPGNVPDEVLLAVREANGLVMVTFDSARTGDSLHAVADHLDHVRAVAGPEGVGLGAAFGAEPPVLRPTGLTDPSGYPRLIAELLDRGWSESDLALLTWGNAQRVIRDAEFTARRRSTP
ncbi:MULTISPECIES: membrane dipeptidase [Streptomyces]|uniref:Dipeptidase n=1 Tax=Streptomyces virginiae TaxID=1961 RepID=A0ABQ3NWN0_STRVG|nr:MULTISPECIES: membrane dipeptidase [Streptomyces]KOU25490.1 dipeptidase [Streptomyces sp. WM6349]KOU90723.1 dipeptidase [Streptomyces sp. XY593]KOV06542.1 dipeptidase [Streptomyces sp. XY533]KOV15005.1 dipeptidase [Streptomyces sp. XY511]KOV44850.1 dipeptidase [Streptomyces sp. H036]